MFSPKEENQAVLPCSQPQRYVRVGWRLLSLQTTSQGLGGDKPTSSPSQRELRPTTMARESQGEKGGPPHLNGPPGAKATPKPKGKRASDPSPSC